MVLAMDGAALMAFLRRDFGQVAEDFTVERADAAGVLLRLKVAERHLRPGGTVSGPSIFGLADVAMYLAILSRIGPVALTVTTSCAVDFMRKPAAGRDLLGEARVLKLGRSLAVGDVMVFSEGLADPVARASLTYAIPPKASAFGLVKRPSICAPLSMIRAVVFTSAFTSDEARRVKLSQLTLPSNLPFTSTEWAVTEPFTRPSCPMINPFAVMLPSISPRTSTEPEEVISPVIFRSAPRTERAELLPGAEGRGTEGAAGAEVGSEVLENIVVILGSGLGSGPWARGCLDKEG